MVNGAIMTRAQFGASSLGQGALKNGFTALTQCLQDAVPILQEQINTYLADLAIYSSVHILGGLSVTSTTAGIISAACWNNNYQLDAVRYAAFRGNDNLRVVNFTDLKGTTGFGDVYTGLDVTLQDSCFANCRNLANIDMLYLVTDGPNRIDPITPQQVKLGRGVLAGTTAQIKMMPKQLEWFEADTTWNKYRDRFLPCIIQPTDEEVKSALKDMAYYDMAHTGYDDTYWTDYIDLARIGGAGFDWLNGRFSGKDIRSFNDFRHFACVGLDFVGEGWFKDCRLLSSIALPNTIKRVGSSAFDGCSALTSIELPAMVESIGEQAFNNCQALTSVRVLATTPAKLEGSNQFTKNISLKIYVPDASVQLYRKQWAESLR